MSSNGISEFEENLKTYFLVLKFESAACTCHSACTCTCRVIYLANMSFPNSFYDAVPG